MNRCCCREGSSKWGWGGDEACAFQEGNIYEGEGTGGKTACFEELEKDIFYWKDDDDVRGKSSLRIAPQTPCITLGRLLPFWPDHNVHRVIFPRSLYLKNTSGPAMPRPPT